MSSVSVPSFLHQRNPQSEVGRNNNERREERKDTKFYLSIKFKYSFIHSFSFFHSCVGERL